LRAQRWTVSRPDTLNRDIFTRNSTFTIEAVSWEKKSNGDLEFVGDGTEDNAELPVGLVAHGSWIAVRLTSAIPPAEPRRPRPAGL
jgi:hypothetical protein